MLLASLRPVFNKSNLVRKIYFLILLGVVACTQQPADYFVLRGTVPGAMDSTMVSLKKLDGRSKLITGYIIGEKFELSGKLDVPTRCELVLDNYDYLERSGGEWESGRRVNIDFFVENGKLTFTTPHLDSLPESFWKYDIRKEKNYKVEVYGLTKHSAFPFCESFQRYSFSSLMTLLIP